MLRSSSANVQDMVILGVKGLDVGGEKYRPENEIVIVGDRPVTYVLSAACAEFNKDNPSEGTTFSLVESGDAVLACIATRSKDVNTSAAQAAVWMHTDKASYTRVNSRFSVSRDEWAAGAALLRSCRSAPALDR